MIHSESKTLGFKKVSQSLWLLTYVTGIKSSLSRLGWRLWPTTLLAHFSVSKNGLVWNTNPNESQQNRVTIFLITALEHTFPPFGNFKTSRRGVDATSAKKLAPLSGEIKMASDIAINVPHVYTFWETDKCYADNIAGPTVPHKSSHRAITSLIMFYSTVRDRSCPLWWQLIYFLIVSF